MRQEHRPHEDQRCSGWGAPTVALLSLPLLTVVCSSGPTPITPPPGSATSGARSAPASATPIDSQPTPAQAGELHVAYRSSGGHVRLFRAGDRVVLAHSSNAGFTLYSVSEQGVKADDELLRGVDFTTPGPPGEPPIQEEYAIIDITGRGSKLERLVVSPIRAQVPTNETYAWQGDRWKLVGGVEERRPWPVTFGASGGGHPPWGAEWLDGSSLFLRTDFFDEKPGVHQVRPKWMPHAKTTRREVGRDFVLEGGKPGTLLPERSAKLAGCECAHAICPQHGSSWRPASGESFPGGHLVLLGPHCQGSLGVERWKPGAKRPVVEILPGSDGEQVEPFGNTVLLARAPDDLFVVAALEEDEKVRPYVAHFDGTKWMNLTPAGSAKPLPSEADSMATQGVELRVHEGGELTLIAYGSVWLGKLGAAGATWQDASPSDTKGFEWLRRGPDGSLWAAYARKLHKRLPGQTWQDVVLPLAPAAGDAAPQRYEASGVQWLPDGSPVIAAMGEGEYGAQWVVLLAKKPAKVLDLDAEASQ